MADNAYLDGAGVAQLWQATKDYMAGNATGYRPVKDAATGRYTNASLAMWLMTLRTGKQYGTIVPKGAESACTKSRANAGIVNPTPGHVGMPAIDPYDGEGGAFLHFDVNGGADSDGTPFVTKIRGIDDDFALDGSQGDVWVLAPTLWWRWDASNTLYSEMVVSDSPLPGLWAQPNAYLPSGQIRPYMLYAKYGGGKGEDGKMHSYSGLPLWIRQVSHNSTITQCQTATTGYSGKTTADDWYVKAMFLSKYATKDSQSVFTGCMSYNYQYAPAVAETGVRRVILTDAQAANLIVGSSMMLGTHTDSSTDRNTAYNYDVFDGARITSIEDYASGQKAVYFDTEDTFDVATTYLLSTAPWGAGCLDAVDGDGTVTANGATSSKEPFKIQGIECQLGAYEVLGNVILDNAGEGFEVCVNHDTRGESTSLTSAYVRTGIVLPTGDADAWHYTLTPTYAGGALVAVGEGTSAQGTHDGTYTNKLSTVAAREFLSGVSLLSGAIGGLWCVLGVTSLGIVWWYFASRLSAIGRSGGEFRAA